jgi:hypothetical protein
MDRIVGAFTTPSPPPAPPPSPAPELPPAPPEPPVDDGTGTDEVPPNTAGEAPAQRTGAEAATPSSRAQANQDV